MGKINFVELGSYLLIREMLIVEVWKDVDKYVDNFVDKLEKEYGDWKK